MSDTIIIPASVKATELLTRHFVMQNVKVIMPSKQNFNIGEGNASDKELYKSSLGTPVLTDLTFEEGSYKVQDGRTFAFVKNVQATVLITLQQTKKIVKTEIQGRDGTVKEYIGMGDYAVTINGILTGNNGQFPIDQLQLLKAVLIAPIAINVTSRYLQLFDIYQIVVESFNIGQQEGGYSYQPFTINAVSDEAVKLIF